jgi:hypothetical protein
VPTLYDGREAPGAPAGVWPRTASPPMPPGMRLTLVLGTATLAFVFAIPAWAGHGNAELYTAAESFRPNHPQFKTGQLAVVGCFRHSGWSTRRARRDLLATESHGLGWAIAFTHSSVAYLSWEGTRSPTRADWRTVKRCLAA